MKDKKHLTQEGLSQIYEIKAAVKKELTEELNEENFDEEEIIHPQTASNIDEGGVYGGSTADPVSSSSSLASSLLASPRGSQIKGEHNMLDNAGIHNGTKILTNKSRGGECSNRRGISTIAAAATAPVPYSCPRMVVAGVKQKVNSKTLNFGQIKLISSLCEKEQVTNIPPLNP
jgi:hypothetical protein